MRGLEPPLHCTIRAGAGLQHPHTFTTADTSQLSSLPAMTEQVTCWLVGLLEELTPLATAMRVLGGEVSRIEMMADVGLCWISWEEAEDTVAFVQHYYKTACLTCDDLML